MVSSGMNEGLPSPCNTAGDGWTTGSVNAPGFSEGEARSHFLTLYSGANRGAGVPWICPEEPSWGCCCCLELSIRPKEKSSLENSSASATIPFARFPAVAKCGGCLVCYLKE